MGLRTGISAPHRVAGRCTAKCSRANTPTRATVAVHQLTVDAYAAQHPGTPSAQSIQSVTVHLVGLYIVFELGRTPTEARKTIQRAVQHKKDFVWLDPPPSLGEMTILDIHGARDHAEHNSRVRKWAMSVWKAWEPHHPKIRRWA